MYSIRIKITIITIVAILTSILSVFAASFTILLGETDRNSVGMMNLIVQDTQKSLEKYFESIEQSVEVAANIAIEDLDSVFLVECGAIRTDSQESVQTEEQIAALDAYLAAYCDKIQDFFAGVADYTHGVTAYYYCISPEISQTERGFYYKKVGKTGFIEQSSLDVAALAPAPNLNETWYEAAVNRGRPVWITYTVSTEDMSGWICSYFVPIYKSGMLIGIMGMDIPCETLVEQIRNIKVYDSGYVCLLDEDEQVIYHPELPIGSNMDELGLDVPKDLLRGENSGDEMIRYTANGDERQMSFCTLSNGMHLASIAPSKEINAPWTKLIREIILISAVIIIFYAILVFFIMRVITMPLKQLTAASGRLADADYDVDLTYRSRDEIGILTASFERMRWQIKKYIDDLNYQLNHDKLTDLPNMRYFFTLAEEARVCLLSEGRQPVMLHFDIIGLKYYNRQYGFAKGDKLIVYFAKILRRQFGEDRICRFSGDHFCAVTDEGCMEEDVQAILRECETALDGKPLPVRVGAYPNRLEVVPVSIACDRAKLAGNLKRGELSSSFTVYDEGMLRKVEVYRHVTNNLDRALSEGWIKIYYQPIMCAFRETVCDEEALARWFDPELGFLSPADFIPALEESKLIYKLDLYVVEQVLKKMNQQKEAGLIPVPQSINLSRMDFERCDVVEEIRRRVDEAGVDRSMISVEITESVIGSDFDFIKEQISRFQQLGFPVWMDDFGSGYSSLDVLQNIQFDLIKFDMRFMESFDDGDESKIILTDLMHMAAALGAQTVCEGVEYQEQAEFLRSVGCSKIQGYYYGRPAPYGEA